MEAKAISKYISMSPLKIRRVLDKVKGKRVDQALDILHFSPKRAAAPIEKTIRSAVANLGNIEEGQRMDLNELFIKQAQVDGGPTLKRFRPMSMGRAGKIRKRTSHLTIVLEDNRKEE